jgi:hypothetical protein
MFTIALNYYQLDALVLLGVVLTILSLRYKQRKFPPLPPGPKGWPIIGNLLQLPQHSHWAAYRAWSDKYG